MNHSDEYGCCKDWSRQTLILLQLEYDKIFQKKPCLLDSSLDYGLLIALNNVDKNTQASERRKRQLRHAQMRKSSQQL